jgi:hypothetical protein
MKRHYIFWTTVFISLCSYSQSNSTTKIRGTFIALWAETLWSYNFKLDNTYQFETSGHFGNTITKGLYKIIQDTIILTAFPKSQQVDPNTYFINDTLLIDNDNCLIGLHLGYEHIRIKHKNNRIYASKRRNLNLPGRPVIIDD